MILDSYLGLIPSQHRSAPNYIEMVSVGCQALIDVQNVCESMIPKFDPDLAVGDQLDIIGEWVGASRKVAIPITGVFFSWDGVDSGLGWDFGSWQGSDEASTISELPDDNYRELIRAKIAANQWDGTTDGAYAAWESAFTDTQILIQDFQDMSYDLAIVGAIVDSVTKAIITEGLIPLKPEGVRINNYWFPVDDGPIFGWNVESDLIKGWNEGSWAVRVPAS